jgi:hypothetical protein
MFNNPFLSSYNAQASIDRINTQIAELEKMKQQLPQPNGAPTNLTQNFQIAPNSTTMKYADSIEEVQRDIVVGDTPYFSKDMSVLWIKNTRGDVKSYELNEIIQKDEKDLQIEFLQAQIESMKKEMNKNESSSSDDVKSTKGKKS